LLLLLLIIYLSLTDKTVKNDEDEWNEEALSYLLALLLI